MSLAACQGRKIYLANYKSDLEFGMQTISQKRVQLTQQAMQNPDESLNEKIHLMDKQLDLKLKTLETQHKAVSTEYESVVKLVDDHAKKDFKYV